MGWFKKDKIVMLNGSAFKANELLAIVPDASGPDDKKYRVNISGLGFTVSLNYENQEKRDDHLQDLIRLWELSL